MLYFSLSECLERVTISYMAVLSYQEQCIKRVEFRKKCFFLSPGTKQTVRIKEVSVKRGLIIELVLACLLAQFQPRGT